MPLLRMDTATLGSSMEDIEENLSSTFRAAERWNALVLLDEADVFLEKRDHSDLERNRLVAGKISSIHRVVHADMLKLTTYLVACLVFLRVLEYFEGIMFLTTNRIESFDRAFKSRIHLTLHYPPLNLESCGKVLRNFLTRTDANVDPELLAVEQINSLMKSKLNGRQIKNAVHIANSLAVSQGVQIGIKHLDLALSAMNDFEASTSSGSQFGPEAAMGSGHGESSSSSSDNAPPRKRQRKDV